MGDIMDDDVADSYKFEKMGTGVGGKSTIKIRASALKNFEEFLVMKKYSKDVKSLHDIPAAILLDVSLWQEYGKLSTRNKL